MPTRKSQISAPYVPALADVAQAAFSLVHQYPGGSQALAAVVSKSPTTLAHEVSPTYPTAKFGLLDAVTLSVWTQDWRIANAFVSQLGGLVIPLPKIVSGGSSLEALGDAAADFAKLVQQVTRAIADGDVSHNELARVQNDAAVLVASVQAMVVRVTELNLATAGSRRGEER